jgi:WD40 repeat protein
VKVWDIATGHETLNLTGHMLGVMNVAFSPDGPSAT